MKARETLHLVRAREVAPIAVRRLEGESEWHYAARVKSIHALGLAWLRHPQYTFQSRHSHDPAVWGAEWAKLVQQIKERAEADRLRNPAYLRAERVREAVGGGK